MDKNRLLMAALIISVLIIALGAFVILLPSDNDARSKVTVSAAASLTESFTEIENKFEEGHPDIDIVLNLAGSGTLRMQIEAGAPIDVFASASQKHMDLLGSENLIYADTRNDFAENSLVMIVPEPSRNDIKSLEDLADGSITKIAIGDPEIAPVGRYTKDALETAFLWDDVSDKLIYAESVKQVLVYVESGEVDAGFVYMTDAMSSDMDKIDVVAQIPVSTSISYPIAVVSFSDKTIASQEFIDYVISDEGKDIFVKYGFTVMDDN
ncbi:molybdate ABC transporter substrate-binding protein [Methanococcoides burtonii]|uniref:Molybdenum ABC transporter, molybdate-binding protein n=1 Tax=Methanococcoides burtonii (strain DSM 6242 / NBRC 107633 / OCM 468 / ACE-M) TaxID=259564 RepID=Q12VR7_METBU|nr:molybdate ABC transporter substrate-binding protein [Methanococcoides burtonii]ABE52459.1 molybdenum ABC transporter, molybdate-binding protein [Methanococcoides burtonii DSM 6242]